MTKKISDRQNEAAEPHAFLFKCPNCGEYPVSEKTLRTFLPPRLKRGLTEELQNGAHGARIDFSTCCPDCEPDGESTLKLVVLRPRLN